MVDLVAKTSKASKRIDGARKAPKPPAAVTARRNHGRTAFRRPPHLRSFVIVVRSGRTNEALRDMIVASACSNGGPETQQDLAARSGFLFGTKCVHIALYGERAGVWPSLPPYCSRKDANCRDDVPQHQDHRRRVVRTRSCPACIYDFAAHNGDVFALVGRTTRDGDAPVGL